MNGDRFIINQMTTNVTTGVVEFELLNDIFNQPSDLVVVEENNSTPPPPPPRVGFSFGMSSTGSQTPSGACGLVANVSRFWEGLNPHPTLGDYIYTDAALTSIYNGGGDYYKISNNILVIRVSIDGLVIDVHTCN
jgi:hypothetical protein